MVADSIWIFFDLDAGAFGVLGGAVLDRHSDEGIEMSQHDSSECRISRRDRGLFFVLGTRLSRSFSTLALLMIRLRYVLILASTLVALADEPTAKPMREHAAIESDSSMLKIFGAIEELLDDKQWTAAVDRLQDISQTHGRSLVLAHPGQAGGVAVYLSVGVRSQMILSRLPPEGLATYRSKVDPQAKRWFENWQRTRDTSELARIVRETYVSGYGDNALWALAEDRWDHGDFASARHYWSQILPLPENIPATDVLTELRYPDSELDPAAVSSRIILCSWMQGQQTFAEDQLRRFEERFPVAQGRLASRQGRFVDLLRQIFDESLKEERRDVASEVATFALTSERTQILPSPVDLGAARWDRPLIPYQLPGLESPESHPNRQSLSTHPVVYRDIVLVNDADSISAFNLWTGEAAWPNEQGLAQIYPPLPDQPSVAPSLACVGVPWFTMTLADGKLLARMGSPVTRQASQELRELSCDLVCLDLEQGQGNLVWKISADEWQADEREPWRFEGSPVVQDGRAFVIHTRTRPQQEFAVTSLDLATGKRLWTRSICTSRSTISAHLNRVSHLLPTLGAGKIFVSTDAGAIVALNARDGEIEWAVTYESRIPADSVDQSDDSKHALVPAMFHNGLVFVAPNDCDRLFCIEADFGQVRWQNRHPHGERWRHLLGVIQDGSVSRLIVSGDSLWSINGDTGKVLNRHLATEAVDQGYGRGVLTQDAIFWPTREALQIIDTKTFQPRRNVLLHTPDSTKTGGNLTIAAGTMLVSQADQLVAYGEYALLKERLNRGLSVHPESDDFRLRLAEIEVAEGNCQAAVTIVRERAPVKNPDLSFRGGPDPRQRARLRDIFRKSASRERTAGHLAAAIPLLTEQLDLTIEPRDRVKLLFELAGTERAGQRIAEAVADCQRILDDATLSSLMNSESTAGARASAEIRNLIHEHGRIVYEAIERRAENDLSACIAAGDTGRLRQTLQQFPNAESTERGWLELAQLEQQAGHLSAACSIRALLTEWEPIAFNRSSAMALWAITLENCGYWNTSQQVWKRLVDEVILDGPVRRGDVIRQASELAREQLSRAEYRSFLSEDESPPSFLNRSWSVNWGGNHISRQDVPDSSSVQAFVPEGSPPSTSHACVLLCQTFGAESLLECRDRLSGTLRWDQKISARPHWFAYAETCLLVASGHELSGLTLEEGTPLWHVVFSSEMPDTKSPAEVQCYYHAPWILSYSRHAGVQRINSRTGEIVWKYAWPGRLQGEWPCGPHRLGLQTLHPDRTLMLDIAAGSPVIELPGVSEAWRSPPVMDRLGRVVLVANTRRVECYQGTNSKPRWIFSGGMSFAHLDPVIGLQGDRLLLTVDGTTLIEIDAENGTPKWSSGLVDLPLVDPPRQFSVRENSLFVAGRGMLRCVSLSDGQRLWETFLGRTEEQWRTVACGPLIAAWPLSPRKSQPVSIVWCDARTGQIVQRTALPLEADFVDVIRDEHGVIVCTDRSVAALISSPRKAMAASHSHGQP